MLRNSFINRLFSDVAGTYEKIARVLIYIVIGVVPLVYFPWTADVLDINKQTVLLFCVFLAVIAWLGGMVARKYIEIKTGWVYILLLLFLLSVAVSSFFSLAPYTSWIGQSSQEYTSFITLLAFILLFLLVSNLFNKEDFQKNILGISFISSGIVGLCLLLNVVHLTHFSTNLIGTPVALNLYLIVMMLVSSNILLLKNEVSERLLFSGILGIVEKIAIIVTAFAMMITALAIDYWVIWALILFGLLLTFIFVLLKPNRFTDISKFILLIVVFILSILFLFLPTFINNVFPGEMTPSYSASFAVGTDTLNDTSFLFGSGPGTFMMDYAKYKPSTVNNTELWDLRFDRSSSHFVTILATFGVLGFGLYLLFILLVGVLSISVLVKKHYDYNQDIIFAIFIGWLTIVVEQALYSSNLVLSFVFWLLSAILISQSFSQNKKIAFSSSPRVGFFTIFLFVFVNVSMLTLIFVTASRYVAEISFAKALTADSSGQSLDDVVLELETSARLNRLSDVYARNLSNAYLMKTSELLQDKDVDPEYISAFISVSINEASRAVSLSSSNVINWILLGDVYREFAPLITNADEFAISSYEKTIELAPNNPKYYTALARAYITKADSLSVLIAGGEDENTDELRIEYSKSLDFAEITLKQAIQLKSDYTPAHYYLALVYERQGNLSDAISRMEVINIANPYDVGVMLQLGLLYVQQGKTAFAQKQFEQAVELAPDFANARWYLSAVYEQQGDLESAIEQMKLLQQGLPDNEMVSKKLERLEQGLVDQQTPEPLEEDSTSAAKE